jgi:hypothetical protein
MEGKLTTMTRCKQFDGITLFTGLAFALCGTLGGCAKPSTADPLTCRVMIDGVPALEVRLVLMRADQGAPRPILEGIADGSHD